MSDPFSRIQMLDAIYEGGRQVGWQAKDSEGMKIMRLSMEAGNKLRKRGRSLTITFDGRSVRQKPYASNSLMQMLVDASGGQTIEAVQIHGKIHDFYEAMKIVESPPTSDKGDQYMVFEVGPDIPAPGTPTLDNWLGFEWAWTADRVLCKGSQDGHPTLIVIPRNPPDWPVY